MGRSPCCSEEGEKLNRGAWTAQEDHLLTSYIMAHGEGKWTHLPKRAGLERSGKSCRLRWLNYLRPDIKRGNITRDEEDLIIRLHQLLGNRWSLIAGRLPGRTDNEIKNYWNTTVTKKLRTQSSCTLMSEQHRPTNKSTARKPDDVTPSQVIQTKPSKCRNVVILHPPCRKDNSLVSNQMGFDEAHQSTQFTNPSQNSPRPQPQLNVHVHEHHQFHENFNLDVNLLSCGNDEFQLNVADLCADFNHESGVAMNTAHSDECLHVDQFMVNWWTTSSSEVDNKATSELDSLILLLESKDWRLVP